MKKIVITIVCILLVVSTNVGQYFYQRNSKEEMSEEFKSRLAEMQTTIDALGPSVIYYTIKDDVVTTPGAEIKEADIQESYIPQSLLSDTFVTNSLDIVGKEYKVAISPGTPITTDMIMFSPIDDTDRDTDIVVCHYPVGLKVGDYVDIRIMFPFGDIYTVLSHIRIEEINSLSLKVYIDEVQQFRYSAACTDYYLGADAGVDLYMTKYIEPGVQKPAEEYYAVSDKIKNCMEIDPNVVDKAKASIYYSLRRSIESELIYDKESELSLIDTGRDALTGVVKSDVITSQDALENEEAESISLIPDEPVDVSSPVADTGVQAEMTNDNPNEGKGVLQ